MTTETYRERLLALAAELGIDDEQAGDTDWAQYFDDEQLADAIRELRPDAEVPTD